MDYNSNKNETLSFLIKNEIVNFLAIKINYLYHADLNEQKTTQTRESCKISTLLYIKKSIKKSQLILRQLSNELFKVLILRSNNSNRSSDLILKR